MTIVQRAIIATVLVLPLLALGCKKPFSSSNADSNANTVANENVNVIVANTNVAPANTNVKLPVAASDAVGRLAMSFVERYGSYSNQSDYGNLENLYPFMTDAFADTTRAFVIAERRKGADTSIYFGVSTRAASFTVGGFDEQDGIASFTVITARQESVGVSSNVRRYTQNALVTMANVGGAWKISGLTWQ